MTVQLMSAGKFRARIRNLSPTGEKHRHTCKYLRTLSMKKSHRLSGVSMMPACFTSLRTALHMLSLSSGVMRSGINPLDSRSLMYTRNLSLMIWPSVMRKVTGIPFTPALTYSARRSVLNSVIPYELVTEIWNTSYWQMKVASLARDCLPEPPTPTSIAFPRGKSKIRVMRVTWSIAWLNRTKSITGFDSLCSPNFSTKILLSFSYVAHGVYAPTSLLSNCMKALYEMGRVSTTSMSWSSKYFLVTVTRISSNFVMSDWCTIRSEKTRSTS
mmetsp:Transcript_14317/g.34861  ORF Transcript_14317/g.34861 Transcript_14317/m.34861 type:complete len:271 (-) Transcript_14317:8417-9229(-)